MCAIHATHLTCVLLLDLINIIISGKEY